MTRVVHISDLHFNRIEPGSEDALVGAIRAIGPSLVIASGDFTMAGRRSEFVSAAACLDRIPCPVVACPGNHDIPAYNLLHRFTAPFRRYGRCIASRTGSSYRSGGVAVKALNSARPWDLSWNWSHGRLSARQIDEAESFFTLHADADTKLLVTHHPFVVPEDVTGFRRIGNADQAIDMCSRMGVHGILTGHLHRQSVAAAPTAIANPGIPVTLLNAGTSLSVRRRDDENGFLLLHCGAGIEAVEAFRLRGDRFEPTAWKTTAPSAGGDERCALRNTTRTRLSNQHKGNRHEHATLASS